MINVMYLNKYRIAQNFGSQNFGGSTHPEIFVEKTLADGDDKSFLLVCTD